MFFDFIYIYLFKKPVADRAVLKMHNYTGGDMYKVGTAPEMLCAIMYKIK
jgi:hypothetical protein